MAHHRPAVDMHLACGPLSRVRRAHSRKERSVRGAELGIVGSRMRQRQVRVGAVTDLIGVVVVLAVIFPEAHLAQLEAAP